MMDISGADCMLHTQSCIPCKGGVPPLTLDAIEPILKKVDSAWSVIDAHHLVREWRFDDFLNALEFLNQAAGICESEGHHADFELAWGRVQALIYTHKIDGLTESDFVLAAKFDQL